MDVQAHRSACDAISGHLATLLANTPIGVFGAFWPFRNEYDPRDVMLDLTRRGVVVALPVVTGRGEPLSFRRWTPDAVMEAGPFGILQPVHAPERRPDVLLVSLLGFDEAGFRLGYGGGYYDRTLAAQSPRPRTIGVGFEIGRQSTIAPQPHDIPMDVIVTERGAFVP